MTTNKPTYCIFIVFEFVIFYNLYIRNKTTNYNEKDSS
jgi:hypothetical protein